MTLLPFDPARIAGPTPVESFPTSEKSNGTVAAQYTVSQVAEIIRTTLERKTPFPLRVVGQVSNLNIRQHWYFSLKDANSVLHCAAWATSARKFTFQPKDGDEIVATGHLSFFGPQGRTQLYVSEIAPVGDGALAIRFRALCEELRKLGYFEEARKKRLPIFPRRIAVITSHDGAAMHDVITTAAQRCTAVGLLIVSARVQGDGAAQEIAHAIRWVDAQHHRLKVDAILVTRGGGSMEDLWAFNERIVADAIFGCSLPIIAAIGHESDTTIAELVADVRASTPTQAAMRLVPSRDELCRQMEHISHRIHTLVMRAMERSRERTKRAENDLRRIVVNRLAREHSHLERLSGRLAKLQPQRVLMERGMKLRALTDRVQRAIVRRIDQRKSLQFLERSLATAAQRHVHRLRERVASVQRQLAAVDPHWVLRRGYSITTHRDGRVVRSAGEVRADEMIHTRVADGTFDSTVARAPRRSHAKPPTAESGGREERGGPETLPQMDLFDSGD